MRKFDRIVLAVILALGLVIAGLSIASARLGPTVDSFDSAELLDGTLVNSQIAITFTQPMRIQSVEKAFSLHPAVAGDFAWSGNQMRFLPRKNLAYSTTYRVAIGTSALDMTGHHLGRPYSRSFTTEARHLLYLGTGAGTSGRLVLASVRGKREVVGPDDGSVTEFSPSFDRSLVAFVRRSRSGGRANELWLLSLADGSTQRMMRRSDWDLSQPHFSPDNHYVVFLASHVRLCRKYYGCFRDSRPEVYLLDLRTHRVRPFHSESDVPITNFIDFSPGGQVAFTDLGSALTLSDANGAHVVHVPNSGNSLQFVGFAATGSRAVFVGQTPSSTGGDILVYDFKSGKYTDVSHGVYDSSTPAFSQVGEKVAYAAYRGEKGIEPIYGINVYVPRTRATTHLTVENGYSDWTPQWSTDDAYIAFVRSRPQEAMYMGDGAVWVVKSDGTSAHPVGGIGSDPQWVM